MLLKSLSLLFVGGSGVGSWTCVDETVCEASLYLYDFSSGALGELGGEYAGYWRCLLH